MGEYGPYPSHLRERLPRRTRLRPHEDLEDPVGCWTTGTSVNGYTIWARLYSPSGSRYVSDYYLSTGHLQSYVSHC